MSTEHPEPTAAAPARPPWLEHLDKRLGPDPSIAEVATRVLCASFDKVRTGADFQAVARQCVDVSAALLQELKAAEVLDEDGQVLARIEVDNRGMYWAWLDVDESAPLCDRQRPRLEARVRQAVASFYAGRPQAHAVIRGGDVS